MYSRVYKCTVGIQQGVKVHFFGCLTLELLLPSLLTLCFETCDSPSYRITFTRIELLSIKESVQPKSSPVFICEVVDFMCKTPPNESKDNECKLRSSVRHRG